MVYFVIQCEFVMPTPPPPQPPAAAAAAAAAQTLSFPEKISSLTHKTFSPEVTVSYPVKSNK